MDMFFEKPQVLEVEVTRAKAEEASAIAGQKPKGNEIDRRHLIFLQSGPTPSANKSKHLARTAKIFFYPLSFNLFSFSLERQMDLYGPV